MMHTLLKKIPIPIAGLMLGLAAAGNMVSPYGDIYKNLLGILSAVIMFLLIIKVCIITESLREGFENPAVASVMPTFSMGLMILSTYIKPYYYSSAYFLWLTGLSLHVIMLAHFTKRYIFNFNINKVSPGYFIVYVGVVCGSVTAPAFGLAQWGQLIFWFGFVAYLLLLPIVLYRVLVIKKIPEPVVPMITILTAPGSLCLAGYLNSFQEKNMTMVTFLGTLSLILFISVMIYIPNMLRLKFYPSYSAFTFPFVITAIAMKGAYAFLTKTGKVIPLFGYFVNVLQWWAIIMVIYVLIRYITELSLRKSVSTLEKLTTT